MSTKSSNNLVNPAAREAMDKFKMEAASDFSVKIHIKKQTPITTKKLSYFSKQLSFFYNI